MHVLQALESELAHMTDMTLLDGGTLSFTLAGPIEEVDALIVVDAANIKSQPGEWTLLQGEEMDTFLLGNRRATVNEVGLTDLRAIAMLAGHWPEKRAMLAIQPPSSTGANIPPQRLPQPLLRRARRSTTSSGNGAMSLDAIPIHLVSNTPPLPA
ncbi:MAG TPA: hydrogenase maturation protease [Thiobacillus sp.]